MKNGKLFIIHLEKADSELIRQTKKYYLYTKIYEKEKKTH